MPRRPTEPVPPPARPTAPRGASRAWPAARAAILALGAGLVFALPWGVPVRADVVADSAVFGFSNAAATLGLAATLLALTVAARLEPPRAAHARRAGLVRSPARRGAGERLVILACAGAGAGLVWGWWRAIPQSWFGESAYFLTRLDMLALGLRPYRDFDYGYGPALLELPWLAHRLSGGRLGADTAFVASVAAQHALGVFAAAALLARVCPAPGVRIAILLVVSAAGLNITLGPIYALLRFVYAPWAAVVFHAPGRRAAAPLRAAAALALALGGWLLSPEVGLATAAALLAGIVVPALSGRPVALAEAAAVIAAPALFVAGFGTESLATLAAFGGGAFNLPVLPAPYMLALLGLACALLPSAGAEALRGGRAAAATAALAAALALLLPAALGRCDPGHVMANGLALAAVALASAWSRDPPRRRAPVAAAVAILLLTHLASQWNQYAPAARAAIEAGRLRAGAADEARDADAAVLGAIGAAACDFGWAKRLPFGADLLALLRYRRVATPLGVPEEIDRFLKLSGRFAVGRHVPPDGGVFGPAAVERVVADTLACDHVLVPAGVPLDGRLRMSRDDYARVRSAGLGGLCLFPVSLPARHDPWIAEFEILRRLAGEYEPAGTIRGLVLLRRRGGAAPAGGQPAPGR